MLIIVPTEPDGQASVGLEEPPPNAGALAVCLNCEPMSVVPITNGVAKLGVLEPLLGCTELIVKNEACACLSLDPSVKVKRVLRFRR